MDGSGSGIIVNYDELIENVDLLKEGFKIPWELEVSNKLMLYDLLDKEFDSIDTKNRIYEIWEVEKHSTLLDRVILKISDLYLYFFKKRI